MYRLIYFNLQKLTFFEVETVLKVFLGSHLSKNNLCQTFLAIDYLDRSVRNSKMTKFFSTQVGREIKGPVRAERAKRIFLQRLKLLRKETEYCIRMVQPHLNDRSRANYCTWNFSYQTLRKPSWDQT